MLNYSIGVFFAVDIEELEMIVPLDELEDLKSIIHEINEVETSWLLKRFGIDPDLLVWLDKSHMKIIESITSEFRLDSSALVHLTHLLSPYGYNTIIGYKENELEY